MSVLETDFLKGLIDPKDKLNVRCTRALSKLKARQLHVASTAFLELDVLLKSRGVSQVDRASVFVGLRSEILNGSLWG